MTTDPTLAQVGTDPVDPNHFYMRYPTLNELLYRGGREGVEYCLVSGINLKRFTDEGFSPIVGRDVVSIEGPKGVVESVILMGRGDPIPGSDDYNGIRRYYVDLAIEETTGLYADPEAPIDMRNTPKVEAKPGRPKKEDTEDIQVIEGK